MRRNAERGFQCVTFSENPHGLGFASLYSGEWDPFFAGCEDTGKFPGLRIVTSEAGVTWVPLVIDRPEHVWKRRASYAHDWKPTDGDSSWPDSQAVFESSMGHLSPEVVAQISYRTAAALYGPEPSAEWLGRLAGGEPGAHGRG